MQDVDHSSGSESPKDVKTDEIGKTSLTPPSGSPVMEKDLVLGALHQQNFMDLSGSDEEEASEVESFFLEQDELEDGEPVLDTSQFLLSPENIEGTDLRNVDPETQARLEALLEAAGIGKLATADGKALADPEVLRRLTSSVSCALDEAAAALTRMRAEQQGQLAQGEKSLAEACSDGDIGTVRKLLDEGRSVHETTEEGESLLSLACSAGYYELAQVLLAMRANVEDRGIKGDCTPLMEAASGGYVDIVKLLISHEADVNAQSSAGNTPLHYAACGGYADVVKVLINAGANVEEHNENGHTPLMEAASAGHVQVAKILLEAGAGINTHSNEFKESALTLACYKGHLEMVKFLLEAGADQEHKTDEMHTALMEASMDGHVEVARLLLDSGAQVNMPADSFESPLTLAACGGHVELANLLIERGANLEEVNDEGYTPLMEAAREGHEEMVALLLAHGADINAQTDETQETALTLACCGGFLEVADFLIKASAKIELGCSTPLMEAAQEGHLELVRYLLKANANVRAQTGTGDTALTYACENGHTDVADVLLEHKADLEHESEGGRTPLMKAARAGHLCTVQFLISKGADVNRQTTNNDHTVLSLACAGGHLAVVELLLSHGADPTHKLKDGSTMLIEAAKGGHTQVVNLLLDYPNSILSSSSDLTQQASSDNSHVHMNELPRVPMQGLNNIVPPHDPDQIPTSTSKNQDQGTPQSPGQVNLKDMNIPTRTQDQIRQNMQKSLSRSAPTVKQKELEARSKAEGLSSETEPDFGEEYEKGYTEDGGGNTQSALDFDIKAEMKTSEKCEKLEAFIKNMMRKADMLNTTREEQIVKKQQILEQLQIVERELHEKAQEQMILSAQQHSMAEGVHQGQGDGQSLPGSSPGKNNGDGKADNVNNSVDMEGVANGLSVIDRLIDSIVIDLDVPSKLGVSGSLPGSEAGSDIFTDADEKIAHLLAKQESTGSLDSVGGLSTASSANQTPVTASEGGDIDGASATSGDAKDEQEERRATTGGIDKEASPVIEDDEEDEDDDDDDDDDEDDDEEEEEEEEEDETCPEMDEDDEEEEDDEEDDDEDDEEDDDEEDDEDDEDDEDCEDHIGSDVLKEAMFGEERSSRASSEEIDLSNVVPAGDKVEQSDASIQQQNQQLQHQQPMQDQLAVARAMLDSQAAALALAGQMVPVSGLDQQTLQQLQTLPIHTVLEQSVAAATSTAAALDQQHQQLQQQRQQLQAQLALQQKLQAELHQQLKLQQEHQQLQQQLKAQQALTQQMELQQLTKHPKFQAQLKQGQAGVKLQQQLPQTSGTPVTGPIQQPVVNLQQLQAQVAKLQPQITTVAPVQAQADVPETELDVTKLHQVQNSLQAQLNQVSRQVQQLQMRQQLTQQELLAQAQQLQQELQQAQQLQQLAQQKHVTQQLTQQDLLQQAQQLQQQLQQAQQLQQLAQQQKQLTHYQGTQKKNKKKNTCAVAPEQLNRVLPAANHNLTYGNHVAATLPGTSQESVTPPPSTPLTPNPSPASPQYCPPIYPSVDLDAQTESNHDTALTLACAGGHVELVSLLLSRGADIEHRDKKGFTPLILAATAGHADVVEMLLDHGADIEAQSERTKDTPLSLACSGGRYEVVELLLARGANKEHRNVSDYTPLSLAASGGYVNIIKLLLSHGAEINSRTGSKLGISPLMLAAMNGHTAAVKLLLDMGSDINAQIETNRNTALTLACFQGRHEVVSLLVDRKANIEHRAKTGLTPLMEAASGGYVEVGRVLLDKGADVNAPPVPSSRDTALTIAADKGHYRFVELLLSRNAAVDVKNKKGNSPLWLACNGGHLDVVQLLVNARADIDSQDNRKVSCLIAAFRKGHVKVVKWMVKHVTQFPSDQECMRYISTITDKELLKKCHQCMEIIVSAKDRQAAEANRHASILLEQLDREKSLEESKKAAAARKREKKRRKKKEKQEQAQREQEKEHVPNKPKESAKQKAESKISTSETSGDKKDDEDDDENDEDDKDMLMQPPSASSSSTTGLLLLSESNKNQRHKRSRNNEISSNSSSSSESNGKTKSKKSRKAERERERLQEQEKENEREKERQQQREEDQRVPDPRVPATPNTANSNYQLSNSSSHNTRKKRPDMNERHAGIGDLDDFGVPSSNVKASPKEKERNRKNMDKSSKASSLDTFGLLSPGKSGGKISSAPSPKKNQKKEEGWKEVTRKTFSTRSKRVTVPSNAISRVIGRGGCNINAIREASGAHIDVDKQKGSGDRVINIKGSTEATRQAHTLISALIKDPDKDLDQLLPKHRQKPMSAPQINNNNTSFLPTASSTAVAASPSAHMFTASVWNNSMAAHITSAVCSAASASLPTSSTAISLPQSKGCSTKVTSVGSTRLSTSTAASVSQMQAPFANVVRQSQSGVLRPGVPLVPPGVLQNGPISLASPKRVPGSVAGVMPNAPKSPGSVARQLFPSGDKSANVSSVKTSVTYSIVSMAKTKVVTATTPTFASKVDNSGRPASSNKMQQKSLSASPAPSSKPSQIVSSSVKPSSELQPLPIKSSNITSNRLISSHQNNPGRQPLAPVGPTEYSPFNNRFSHELEMLNKKEEMDRKDFASVAAAGVIPSSSSVMSSVSPAPIDSQPDPTLPAKAPGYKYPGQRTSSPQINEHDPRSKVPSYVGLSQAHAHQAPSPQNPQMLEHVGIETLVPVGPSNYPHPGGSQQSNLGEADPSKAPGFKGFPDHQDIHSRTSGYRTHAPISHPNMSPRPSNIVGPHGVFSSLLQSHPRNEYSTPDQPMTLPKIESTLNPNAPDFTSRTYEASSRFPNMPGMGSIGPGFGSGFNSLSNIAALAGLTNLQSTLGPALGMGNPGGYRVPPPSVSNVMNQQSVGNMMPGSEFLNPDLSGTNGQVFTRFAHATLINSGAMNVPSNMSRPFKPMPPTGPSAATTPPVGASKRESPVPTVASEPSPSSSSAPSPTDHAGMMAESFNRQLRPIGTERAQKKPHAPGYSSMGEAGAAGLWAYNTDLSGDWMSSVITTSVVTSAVMTPGSAEGEEPRPASHPAMSPHMRPPYPDSHLDPAVETQFGQAAVLIANSAGPAVIAANGVPAGAAAALPMASHVYTQAPMAADTLPSMWNQQVKPEPSGQQEAKMMWNNNWNNPQNM